MTASILKCDRIFRPSVEESRDTTSEKLTRPISAATKVVAHFQFKSSNLKFQFFHFGNKWNPRNQLNRSACATNLVAFCIRGKGKKPWWHPLIRPNLLFLSQAEALARGRMCLYRRNQSTYWAANGSIESSLARIIHWYHLDLCGCQGSRTGPRFRCHFPLTCLWQNGDFLMVS